MPMLGALSAGLVGAGPDSTALVRAAAAAALGMLEDAPVAVGMRGCGSGEEKTLVPVTAWTGS